MTSAVPPNDDPPTGRRGRLWPWTIAAVAIIVLGGVIGWFVGTSIAEGNAERDDRAAERASEQEDAARDRRDLLDARTVYIDAQTKPLGKVATSAPLLGSEKTTAEYELGEKFSVDGGTYVVRGLRIVDTFTSKDPRRPVTQRKGFRWALVEVDYTNRTREQTAPACGTMGVIRVVQTNRIAIDEVDHSTEKPPVAEDTYDTCGNNVAPGRTVRWSAPVRVPENAKLAGILVADVYARTTDSEYNVQSGKQAWLPFEEPIDVGESGDDPLEQQYVGKDAS